MPFTAEELAEMAAADAEIDAEFGAVDIYENLALSEELDRAAKDALRDNNGRRAAEQQRRYYEANKDQIAEQKRRYREAKRQERIGTMKTSKIKYRNLRAEMARRGITQRDISRVIGKCVSVVCNKLAGKTRFSTDEIFAIRNIFFRDMSIEYLFDDAFREQGEGDEAC